MNVKELRIGNTCQWGQFAPMGNGVFNINIGSLNYANFIDPIPITECNLIKLGWDKALNGWWDESECFSLYDGFFRIGTVNLIKCEYIHQLQNLYFALTGKELKI